jgi:hypothetical protein
MAHLIKPDGTVEELKPAKGKMFTLEELQKVVGGYLEHVKLGGPVNIAGVKYHQCFVNEDGKRMQLEFNYEATALWKASFPFGTSGGFGDTLVGNVLFFTDKEVD